MSQKTKMLNRIIHYLILNASFIRDLGLLDGKWESVSFSIFMRDRRVASYMKN